MPQHYPLPIHSFQRLKSASQKAWSPCILSTLTSAITMTTRPLGLSTFSTSARWCACTPRRIVAFAYLYHGSPFMVSIPYVCMSVNPVSRRLTGWSHFRLRSVDVFVDIHLGCFPRVLIMTVLFVQCSWKRATTWIRTWRRYWRGVCMRMQTVAMATGTYTFKNSCWRLVEATPQSPRLAPAMQKMYVSLRY